MASSVIARRLGKELAGGLHQLVGLTDPYGRVVTYARDGAGRLASVTCAPGRVATCQP